MRDASVGSDVTRRSFARPILELFASYFRPEVRGFERLPPRGPFLVVGNHSGGQIPPDLPVLFTAWWRERGEDEPVFALFHSFFLGLPGRGPGHGTSRCGRGRARRGGGDPSRRGDPDRLPRWRLRGLPALVEAEPHRVRRSPRLRSSRAANPRSPSFPSVSVGAHETLVVLARGERVAKLLGLDRMFRHQGDAPRARTALRGRSRGIPTWPLPAKITVELGEPIDWSSRYGPEAAGRRRCVRACYEELTGTMQATLDRLAAARRFPILG